MDKLLVHTILLLLISLSVKTSGKSLDYNVPALIPGSHILIKGNSLRIICKFNSITEVVPRWRKEKTFKEIYLDNCILPETPIVEVFKTLNIKNEVKELHYRYLDEGDKIGAIGPLHKANYTHNLDIENLEIASKNADMLANNPEFLEQLKMLKNLTVYGVELSNVPSTMALDTMSLEKVKSNSWGNCKSIKELQLRNIEDEKLPEYWPSNCSRLTSLNLENLSSKTVKQLMTEIPSSKVEKLIVKSAQLMTLPYKFIETAKDLRHLDLSNNNLEDKKFSMFPVLKNLTTLNLSNNKLSGWFIVDLAGKLPSLKTLILDGNKFYHSFRYNEIKIAITQLTSLENLSMNRMYLDPDCLMSAQFSNLRHLSLASNEPITTLLLNGLPTTNASTLEVDLRGRPVRSVPINSDELELKNNQSHLHNITKLTLLLSYIDCDCNNAELAKLLKNYPQNITMPNLKCNNEDGGNFLDEPSYKMECKKEKIHDCIKRIWDFNTVVDCSDMMKSNLPWSSMTEYGVRGVNASGNFITTLKDIDFDWLQWVDLRNNRLSRLNRSELIELFSLRSRKLWLSGNVFICDCENRALLKTFHRFYNQIMDYDSLMCVDNGRPLSEISVFEVCRIGRSVVWASCCVFSVLTVLIMVIIRRYGGLLRTFIFSRGYCLSCLSVKDPDGDRPYDAFISFAHGDDSFVTEQLLPRLELTPRPFRVCVHFRDWVVGDWIPAQIMRSVRLSKRTIIILSRNFISSWWGVLEFRYAHAQAMAEGKSRLLVLVLDNALDEKLEPELQGYLATNTFLKLDDPWFWDKLHYALTHDTMRYHSWWETKFKCFGQNYKDKE